MVGVDGADRTGGGGLLGTSSALALAVRTVRANWPDPDDTIEAVGVVMALRPSAERLGEQLAEPGVALDDLSEAVAVELMHRLGWYLTLIGHHAASVRHLGTALRLAQRRGDFDAAVSIEVDIARAEGRGANPDDGSLRARKQRASSRLERILSSLDVDHPVWPIACARRWECRDPDLDQPDRLPPLDVAFDRARGYPQPFGRLGEVSVRYGRVRQIVFREAEEAFRAQLEALDHLRRTRPASLELGSLLNSAAITARVVAAAEGPSGWTRALELRAESTALARRWLAAAIEADVNSADGYHRALAQDLSNGAFLLRNVGDLDTALADIQESIRLTKGSWQVARANLAERLSNRANIHFARREYEQAMASAREALELGDQLSSKLGASRLAWVLICGLLCGEPLSDAQATVDEIVRRIDAGEASSPSRPLIARGLHLAALGDPTGSELIQQAWAVRTHERTADHPDVLYIRALHAVALQWLGSGAEAERERSVVRQAIKRTLGRDEHWIVDLADLRLSVLGTSWTGDVAQHR